MANDFNTKRIKDWAKVATRAMLKFGNFLALDGDDGTYKVPAEFFAFIENFKIASNAEYLYAITDKVGRFLFGIRPDGSVDWPKGIPDQIRVPLEQLLAEVPTKVDKEAGKSLIDSTFASGVKIASNAEYLYVITGKDGDILFGIRRDGSVDWTKGIATPLKNIIDNILTTLNNKVDSVAGKGLIDSVFASGVSVISNVEFIFAVVDSTGSVLFGVKKSGDFVWAKGMPPIIEAVVDSLRSDLNGKQDAVNGKTVVDSNVSNHVSSNDVPDWFSVLLDNAGRIIEGIRPTGERVFNLPVKFDGGVNWTPANMSELAQALKDSGFVGGTGDWSDKASVNIPIPEMAIVNFTNIDQMPQTKDANAHAYMEFWDMNGNYFKKKVIANAQGSSSMKWSKKNVAIDICNDDWVGDDTFKVKFGEWVPQDSFHLKAYATDYFKCVGLVGYDVVKQMMATRSLDTTWKQSLNYGNDPIASKTISTRLDSGALCYPQGFICKVYLNGVFEGLFCWQLKKHRDNYNMKKSTATHIHIEGMLGAAYFWNGNIDWTQFEVRNPKSLITYTGEDYDGDNPSELIDSTSPVYDASNSKHKNTAKVKQYIIALSQRMMEVYAAEPSNQKTLFEKYFGLDSCVDYAVLSDALYNYDYLKNIQWTTWDGEKWFLNFYDMDCTLGIQSTADSIHYPTSSHTTTATMHPLNFVVSNYTAELESRWSSLRAAGIIDARNIAQKIDRYLKIWGKEAFDAEYAKWTDYPYDRDMVVDTTNWELEVDSDGSPVIYTTSQNPWNSATSYQVGDAVQYNPSASSLPSQGWWYRFTATQANSNKPPVTKTGFHDNLPRVYNWLKQQIMNMDTLYNYTQGG